MNRHLSVLFILLLAFAAGAAAFAYRTGMGNPPAVSENEAEEEEKKIILEPEEEPVEEPEDIEPEIEEHLKEAEVLDLTTEETKEETVSNNTAVSENQVSENQKEEEYREPVVVDLIVFAGQSNMSGYGGDVTQAPKLTEGAGGEFRSVSDPTCLYTIVEPFGFYENTAIMNDFYLKKGSLVTSFVNAYYEKTNVPVVAVSASKGGMSSPYWASDAVCAEVVTRFRTAYDWLNGNGYRVRFKYLVFLQGENNVIEGIPIEQYQSDIYKFSEALYHEGLDKFFMIRIGGHKQNPDAFDDLIAIQTELCRNNPNFVLASTVLSAYGGKDMVDDYHYTQQVLNDVGDDAGRNVGEFSNTWTEPSMYDYKYGTTYEPQQY